MLELKNISWEIPDGDKILKGIDLEIPDGKMTVITGRTVAVKLLLQRLSQDSKCLIRVKFCLTVRI